MSMSPLALEILSAGRDDWVPLLAVAGLARRMGATTGTEIIDRGVGAIAELVELGFVEVGSVSDGGFSAWSDEPTVMLARVETTWRSSTGSDWEFYCWINNTPAGDVASDL